MFLGFTATANALEFVSDPVAVPSFGQNPASTFSCAVINVSKKTISVTISDLNTVGEVVGLGEECPNLPPGNVCSAVAPQGETDATHYFLVEIEGASERDVRVSAYFSERATVPEGAGTRPALIIPIECIDCGGNR
jgi:hypothetical protein